MSRGLKMLARELEVPVIALSQLNRVRSSRGPTSARCSPTCASPATLEQDADLVMFIYRDEYYTRRSPRSPAMAEIVIAKNRNGPLGTVTLTFQGEYPRS